MAIPTSMTSGGVILQRAGYRVAALSADPTFWTEIQCSSSTAFASSRSQIQKLAPSAANQVLATFEMPFSTRTYFSRARSFKAGYSTGAWSTVASGQPYYLVDQMPDPGYYAHHVSRFGLLTSARTKTMHIAFSDMDVILSTKAHWSPLGVSIAPKAANTTIDFAAAVALPPGVTIIKFRARLRRNTSQDAAKCWFYRISTADVISYATTLTLSTWGLAKTLSSTVLSILTKVGESYEANPRLMGKTTGANAQFYWAEIDYTMPSLDKAL